MKKIQSGFTLVEIVMVIVIIGILAAIAVPQFINLKTDAYTAAAQGFAGAFNAANSINVVGCAAKNGVVTPNVCATVAKCSDLKALVQPLPTVLIGAIVPPTASGTLYLAVDTASSASGASCAAKYGDGGAGTAFTFIATTAP